MAPLRQVLEDARRAGFIGRQADLDAELAHAREFGIVASGLDDRRVADLGAGGGLPGLVLAMTWPRARISLIESSATRARFLSAAVDRLGCEARVVVAHRRAEEFARESIHRQAFEVVVARSFAPPAVTAECAAGLLVPGGVLVVSEPPDGDMASRWPSDACAALGFDQAELVVITRRFARLRLGRVAPDRVPRRAGVPGKRPLW